MSVNATDFLWLLVALGFLAVDAFAGFVLFPIYISAAIVFIVNLFIDNLIIELLLFIILTTVLFLVFRPKIKKFMKDMPKIENKSFVSIGEQFKVEEVDTSGFSGKIKKDGIFYNIYSHQKLNPNDWVKAIKIDGLKVFVEKINKEGEN
ncbi:NfeD family protein [Caldicellulosiruptoraceae bacterium PP1]